LPIPLPVQIDTWRWTADELNDLLAVSHSVCADASARCAFWAMRLYGTPFIFESTIAPIPRTVAVRLSSFDCITFLYAVIALANARSVPEFLEVYARLRYSPIAPAGPADPVGFGLLHFAEEALLELAVKAGYLRDITGDVALTSTREVSVLLGPVQRPKGHDPDELVVTPAFGQRIMKQDMILPAEIPAKAEGKIRSGDIVFFTKSKPDRAPVEVGSLLINHGGVCIVEDNLIYFIHSTRSFAWREDAMPHDPPRHTGIYLNGDIRRELIGVGFAGEPVADELKVKVGHLTYHGYDQSRKRLVRDYACDIFQGAMFFRCNS
jgi:Protein of unknown function (DUF1460)